MEVLKYLNIPLIQPQRVYVKDIVAQLNATGNDKKLIESHISTMKLVSLLNEQTIRIRSYKDDNYSFFAIYVFFIDLKKNDNMSEFSSFIHAAFPESTLLIMKYSDIYYISTASKRINKLDNTKTVLEDVVTIKVDYEAFGYLSFSQFNCINLKEYNENIVKLVYRLKVFDITRLFPMKDLDYKELIRKYENTIIQINRLKQDYKQTKMLSEQIRIDDDLYDKELELKAILRQIKGG